MSLINTELFMLFYIQCSSTFRYMLKNQVVIDLVLLFTDTCKSKNYLVYLKNYLSFFKISDIYNKSKQ